MLRRRAPLVEKNARNALRVSFPSGDLSGLGCEMGQEVSGWG